MGYRKTNFVADRATITGYPLPHSTWDHSLPLCAMNAFYFDQLGLDCNRNFCLIVALFFLLSVMGHHKQKCDIIHFTYMIPKWLGWRNEN